METDLGPILNELAELKQAAMAAVQLLTAIEGRFGEITSRLSQTQSQPSQSCRFQP
jgi:hypothetical protein